jgi:ferrous iron transport protein A
MKEQNIINLADLPVGTHAKVSGFGIQSPFTERLQEMGMIPGTILRIIRRAPFRGPLELMIGNSHLAMRPHEGELILVQPLA